GPATGGRGGALRPLRGGGCRTSPRRLGRRRVAGVAVVPGGWQGEGVRRGGRVPAAAPGPRPGTAPAPGRRRVGDLDAAHRRAAGLAEESEAAADHGGA